MFASRAATVVLLCSFATAVLGQSQYVTSITPTAGSLNGETRLTIYGAGFAESQFDMFEDVGNVVSLVSKTQILDCPVHKDGSHETQVMCYTPKGMPADSWTVRVSVNGISIPEGDHCEANNDLCKFESKDANTPKINYIRPTSGEPGTVIQINGLMFTNKFETNKAASCNGNTERILRVYVGSKLCEIRVPDGNDEYYGLGLDADCAKPTTKANDLCLAKDCDSDWGFLKCLTGGTYVGYQNVSFILSGPYGRSLGEMDVMRYNALGKLSMYETYAVVNSISPSVGSVVGGTYLTVNGQNFDDTDAPIEVLVGGVPCSVMKFSDTQIICVTPEQPDFLSGIGNRGIIKEFFNDTDPSDRTTYNKGISDIANFTNPRGEQHLEALEWKLGGGGIGHNYYATRHRGYLVPPADGQYEFFVRGDDKVQLYVSPNDNPSDMVLRAQADLYTADYTTLPSQRSGRMSLEKGMKYYFELVQLEGTGSASVYMKLHLYNTAFEGRQAGNVFNEVQQVKITSTVTDETTRFSPSSLTAATPKDEVQTLQISSANPGAVFRLGLYGAFTEALPVASPGSSVQSALGKLPSLHGFTVTVTAASIKDGMSYAVTLKGDGGDWPPIEVIAGNDESEGSITSDVQETKTGVASDAYYQLSFGGAPTASIAKDATATQVQTAIEESMAVRCPAKITTGPNRQHFFTYETAVTTMQYVSGIRVSDIVPFCGRYSLKNPAYLFGFFGTTPSFDAQRKGKICFAYQGQLKQRIDVYHTYTANGIPKTAWDVFDADLSITDGWGYTCFDMFAAMIAKRSATTGSMVHRITLWKEDGVDDDFYVDEVYIGGNMLVQPNEGPGLAKYERLVPDRWIMDTVSVTGDPNEFTVNMKIMNCESNIPLMSLARTAAAVTPTRDSTASPAVTGSFDLTFRGQTLTGIAADMEAEDLKSRLETLEGLGQVTVTRTGTCAGYIWNVELVEGAPGDHPEMTADGSSIRGTDAAVTILTIQDGGVSFDPLRGDMMRTHSDTSQVAVTINQIPSKCSGDCTFEWTNAATPTISAIDPASGSEVASTSLTITGTGFSTAINNVSIGNTECTVTSQTATEIQCNVGQGPAGPHKVLVNVGDKGLADHVGGSFDFTYNFQVASIDPTSGSEAGGTLLTITGTGFGDILNVTIDSNFCDVQSSSYEAIVCLTPLGSGSNHPVVISDGINAANGPGFTYDNGLTPTVTAISTTVGAVEGGTDITITGTTLGASAPNANAITLGGTALDIISWSDTSIEAKLPSLGPGTYSLVFNLDDGYADISAISAITYALTVTGISPETGSLQGGSKITIVGSGFSLNNSVNSVMLGEVECLIVSSSETEIECITGSSSETYNVDNQGVSASHGQGYEWSPKLLNIQVGDTVRWSWFTAEFLTGIAYRVERTATETSSEYAGSGFKSGTAGKRQGVYEYQFTNVGTFYYWSECVDDGCTIKMRGTVKVTADSSVAADLSVKVNGFEANYNGGSKRRKKRSACPDVSGPKTGCSDSSISGGANSIIYTYAACSTPEISAISPTEGTSTTVITITGSGLGTDNCQNEVTINGKECVLSTSSETQLTCTLDPADSVQVGVPYAVVTNVLGRGKALNKITDVIDRSFVLKPLIASISPASGSTAGGTELTITGNGFSSTAALTSVTIGGAACAISSLTYTEIVCTTGNAFAGTEDIVLQVYSNGVPVPADCAGSCTFEYSTGVSPTVTAVSPTIISSASTTLTITGTNFGTVTGDVVVMVGDTSCTALTVTATQIECDAGQPVVGVQPFKLTIANIGYAVSSVASITVQNVVTSVTPSTGSVLGGTLLTIVGLGYKSGDTTINVGANGCPVESVTPVQIVCTAPPATDSSEDSTVTVSVTSNSVIFTDTPSYDYALAQTPAITGITPSSGSPGDSVTIAGTGFGSTQVDVTVHVGNGECTVTAVTETSLECTLGSNAAGTFSVSVHISGKGLASGGSDHQFTYSLSIASISPSTGSFGGGQVITITGSGYEDSSTSVAICGESCLVNSTVTTTTIECITPAHTTGGGNQDCDVVVNSGNATVTESDGYTYDTSVTPDITSVTPARGGTGGGTSLTIAGSNFGTNQGDISVSIDGVDCPLNDLTDTEIVCTTGAHRGAVHTKVRVEKGNDGIATQDSAGFFYVDVWSSLWTWGGGPLPTTGDFIVIPKGMTVLLDVDTPVLLYLLIQGGELIFDEKDVELNARNILITDDGLLQVGTAEEPFQHKGKITLHGVSTDKEMPIYGTKCIAVREGRLELHGQPVHTWTMLDATASAGDTTITVVADISSWNVGDEIVIATTGDHHSQIENEERTITAISGKVVTLDRALEYKHLGEDITYGSHVVPARAEVGLLTRNVVVGGSRNIQFETDVPKCEEGFDTGEFATQTCFQGRFGEEIGSDQFGGHIIMHAPAKDSHKVTGHIEYVEVTNAGQAFRLGRYAIHFHLNGNMRGSYVRGCAIHQSYNRAINVHGTHEVVLEHNVAYNIMGGAFFTEDGVESNNTFQYNLAVFVKSSTSLQNDDITPAAFWVTNPNNIVQHNHAAGGTHFGFWYRMHEHPDAGSFDPNICPQGVPLRIFTNNTVHSHGWFGVWIFEQYLPVVGGVCGETTPEPADFNGLTAWNCEKGAETVGGSAIKFTDFAFYNNKKAGYEFKMVTDLPSEFEYNENGPQLSNGVIGADGGGVMEDADCDLGVILPYGRGFSVNNVEFVNFNKAGTVAFGGASVDGTTEENNGGYTYKTSGLTFTNSNKKVYYRWKNEFVLDDLDGTLTGQVGGKVVPNDGIIPTSCSVPGDGSLSGNPQVPGAACPGDTKFHRFSWNHALPDSMNYKNTSFSTETGSTIAYYQSKRFSHKEGWHVLLPDKATIMMSYVNSEVITNMSFTGTMDDFEEGDYIIMKYNFTQGADRFIILDDRNSTYEPITPDDYSGDWYFDESQNVLEYIISGKRIDNSTDNNFAINFNVYQCYYVGCGAPVPTDQIPPASARPENAVFWSQKESWAFSEEGYGSYYGAGDYGPPTDDTDVVIPPGVWMVADTTFPRINKLYIYGTLEFEHNQVDGEYLDFTLSATHILISSGRMIVGWEDAPFRGNADIVLRGSHNSRDIYVNNGPNVGSKCLGVFGGLDIHGIPKAVTWTQLASTANVGDTQITLMENVDWSAGDKIVIAATSFDWEETETATVQSVTDNVVTLNSGLQFMHYAVDETIADGVTHNMAAEVGLLSHNVRVIGEDYDQMSSESFGARVIMGYYNDVDELGELHEYYGYARISNVEFYHAGQEGWVETYDPRFAVSFLDTGDTTEAQPGYLKSCSFNENFSPAIGVFGCNGIELSDNVIYHTVGSSMLVQGFNHIVEHNLVTRTLFCGTYNGKYEKRLQIDSGIEIQEASDIIFRNNHVAGSEHAGIRMDGERCPTPGQSQTFTGNVAHSSMIGAMLFLDSDGLPPCTAISNITVYRNWDYGFYAITAASIKFYNFISIDNGLGLFPIIMGPAAVGHAFDDKFVEVHDSFFVGTSSVYDCDEGHPTAPAWGINSMMRGFRHSDGGPIGLSMASFTSGSNGATMHPMNGIMAYQAIRGITKVEGTTFSKFGNKCTAKSFAVGTPQSNDDAIHPMVMSNSKIYDTRQENKAFFSRPNIDRINPSDCVDMDCDGLKKAVIKDLDGTFLETGSAGSIIAESEFEWDGDPVRGLGDFRIPVVMLTDDDGNRLEPADFCPNKGIYRDSTCAYQASYQAWQCGSTPDYYMLMLESMDHDTESRRVSPIALYTDSFVDLINGPQDHGWCFGYTCQERLSTFPIIMAAGKEYNLYFSGTTPQKLRYHWLNNDDAAVLVGVWYAASFRLDVYADGAYVLPTNGEYNEQGQLLKANPPANNPNLYMPNMASDAPGANYWDNNRNILWLMLKGSVVIDVETNDQVIIMFNVPSMSVDEFFGANIVANLANFFNVPASKIRYANAVSEGSRKRRDNTQTVIITIENPPGNSSDASSLSSAQMANISSSIISTYQLGGLESVLNITILSMTVIEPPPSTDSPSWQVMAELGVPDAVPLQVPSTLEMTVPPVIIHEGADFSTQPALRFKDSNGDFVVQIGSELDPWQIQVSLIQTAGGDSRAVILGNTIAPVSLGWANFTDLKISHSGSYLLNFTVVSPVGASHFSHQHGPITVNTRALAGTITSAPNTTIPGQTFDMEMAVVDGVTGEALQELDWKDHTFTCTASIYMPDTYAGELSGVLIQQPNSNGSVASFVNLALTATGRCNIQFRCISSPSYYDVTFLSDLINIYPQDYVTPTIEVSKRVTLKFNGDFATLAAGKEASVANAVYNVLAPKYQQAIFRDFTIYEGSIMVDFYMDGTSAGVDNATNGIWEDLKAPLVITVDGQVIEADGVMWVEGGSFYGLDGPSNASSKLEPWAIALIVLFVIAFIVGAVLVVLYLKYKDNGKDKRKMSMTSPNGSRVRVGPDSQDYDFGRSMKTTTHISNNDLDIYSKEKGSDSTKTKVIIPKAAPQSTVLPNHLQWQRSHSGLYRTNAVDPVPPYTEN